MYPLVYEVFRQNDYLIYLVKCVSLEILMHRDGRALVGLNDAGAVHDDVHVRDGKNPGFA